MDRSLSFTQSDGMTTTTTRSASNDYKPLTVHLLVAADALSIGHRNAYVLAKTGQLVAGVPVICTGRKTAVPVKALEDLLGPLDDFLIAQGLMSSTEA